MNERVEMRGDSDRATLDIGNAYGQRLKAAHEPMPPPYKVRLKYESLPYSERVADNSRISKKKTSCPLK